MTFECEPEKYDCRNMCCKVTSPQIGKRDLEEISTAKNLDIKDAWAAFGTIGYMVAHDMHIFFAGIRHNPDCIFLGNRQKESNGIISINESDTSEECVIYAHRPVQCSIFPCEMDYSSWKIFPCLADRSNRLDKDEISEKHSSILILSKELNEFYSSLFLDLAGKVDLHPGFEDEIMRSGFYKDHPLRLDQREFIEKYLIERPAHPISDRSRLDRIVIQEYYFLKTFENVIEKL